MFVRAILAIVKAIASRKVRNTLTVVTLKRPLTNCTKTKIFINLTGQKHSTTSQAYIRTSRDNTCAVGVTRTIATGISTGASQFV